MNSKWRSRNWEPMEIENPADSGEAVLFEAFGGLPGSSRACSRRKTARIACNVCIAAMILTSAAMMVSLLRRTAPRDETGCLVVEEAWTRNPEVSHVLANELVWSHDSKSIVFDNRDRDFDGTIIGTASAPDEANIDGSSGENVRILYKAENTAGGRCGVSLWLAGEHKDSVVFILGPEEGDPSWEYSYSHRRGVVMSGMAGPGRPEALDARDVVEPFTPGALRGGTHVHKASGDGRLVASTYEDSVLPAAGSQQAGEANRRLVALTVMGCAVSVPDRSPHNVNGSFTVAITEVTDSPAPGSDDVMRAHDHAWVGSGGYMQPINGQRQKYAVAFLGDVLTSGGETATELFVADIPEDLEELEVPSTAGPLQGTASNRPLPPAAVSQRRLTRLPGGVATSPRFWPASSPDGSRIAFLAPDTAGVVQIWIAMPGLVSRGDGDSPDDGGKHQQEQLTHNAHSVSSAYTWSPDGRWIAHAMNGSVCVTAAGSGDTFRLTREGTRESEEGSAAGLLRPEAVVWSPDGSKVAYMRGAEAPQIWVLNVQRTLMIAETGGANEKLLRELDARSSRCLR